MMNRIYILVFFGMVGILSGCSSIDPKNIDSFPRYQVKEALSGDTVLLENGEVVSYFGIRCPKKGELFYQEAKEQNKKLVENKTIAILEGEGKNADGTRRVYAYLPTALSEIPIAERAYVPKEKEILYRVIQNLLLAEGLARVSEESHPQRQYYEAFQKQATSERRGIWAVNESLSPSSSK